MDKPLSENELCATVWEVLKERFGPGEAMRFLSMIRNPPRHYQQWREQHFKALTTEQLIERMKAAEHPSN